MKLLTAVVPLLCATLASSRSLTSPNLSTLDAQFPVPGENPLEFCTDPSSYLTTVEYVNLDPNPPQPGQQLTVTANGTIKKTIKEGAKVQLIVKYNGFITLINQVADFCENLSKINLACPLEAGELAVHEEVKIPAFVPPGSYQVFAKVINDEGEEVTCMESTVHFG